MSETATAAAERNRFEVNHREIKVRQMTAMIFNELRDYIPERVYREAHDKLSDTLFNSDLELVGTPEMEEVRAWRKTKIENMMLTPSLPIQPIRGPKP